MNPSKSRIRVLPYKSYSKSAKALASEMGAKRLKLSNSSFKPIEGDLVINWGNRQGIDMQYDTMLNDPYYIEKSGNKLLFMEMMKGANLEKIIPRFWTTKEDIPEDAYPVVCRTILNGHSGSGIVIADTPDSLVECQLYVEYVKKKDEYRVHVGMKDGKPEVFSLQQKKRKLDHDNPNWQVRSHANGFVYTREGVNPPSCVPDVARTALNASGLNFGAVYVIYNENAEKAYVLEINTAPGLEGQTVKDYADFIRNL